MRICDETNPCSQADFSVIPSTWSRQIFLYMISNYMNIKSNNGFSWKSKMLSCHLTEQFQERIF
jgi:hypothetical protein